MMVDYCLVISKEDVIKQRGCWIGSENFDLSRIMYAYEMEEITEDFIAKIKRILDALGTHEQSEIDDVINWLTKNKGKQYFIETD